MNGVLETAGWCGPAVRLLRNAGKLPGVGPTMMHIRHSERERVGSQDGSALTTEAGREAAHEFGARLPPARVYRVWHTSVTRTRETGQDIVSGLESVGNDATLVGQIPVTTILDADNFYPTQAGYQPVEDTDQSARTYFSHWVSGFYPPTMVRPSLEFAVNVAEYMRRSEGDDSFDILVSHDTWVAALMFHWFGLPPGRGWVGFLDGFALELGEPDPILATGNGVKEVKLPHWWREPRP